MIERKKPDIDNKIIIQQYNKNSDKRIEFYEARKTTWNKTLSEKLLEEEKEDEFYIELYREKFRLFRFKRAI